MILLIPLMLIAVLLQLVLVASLMRRTAKEMDEWTRSTRD